MKKVAIYLLVLLVVFAGIFFATVNSTTLNATSTDLSSADFSTDSYDISMAQFEFYPDALITPEEFASSHITTDKTAYDEKTDAVKTEYATYRIVLNLPKGYYGLLSSTPSYSARVFVDGEEVFVAGKPASTAEETETKAARYVVCFQANGETEIVIQRANFNHRDEGILPAAIIGSQQNITEMYAKERILGSMLFGAMVISFLFFLGLYLLYRNNIRYLWFALSSLTIGLRSTIIQTRIIMLAIPNLSWVALHRMEYLFTLMFVTAVILYVLSLFEIPLKRPVNILMLVVLGLSIIGVLILPSIVFTSLLMAAYVVFALYVVALVIQVIGRIAVDPTYRSARFISVYVGIIALAITIIVDMTRHLSGGFLIELNLAQIGMMIFALGNALSLAVGFSQVESQLNEALVNRDELLAKLDKKEASLRIIKRGSLILEPASMRALIAGVDILLTPREFTMLLVLVSNEGRAVSASELYEIAWGAPAISDVRTVRTQMSRLREKLSQVIDKEIEISTRYGKGYIFRML
jgi:hypothetical protein